MEAVFLKVLNMSITASYVIAAILVIRLLLKKVPKKYNYVLWSVVLFRLICPVSFSAIFSIFNARPFDMSSAQSAGGAVLQYVPADIGTMTIPQVSVGIPAANTVINETIPASSALANSVNPIQTLIYAGTLLWCVGMAALLLYSVVSFIRLKHRMATAVLLEGNVYESEKIHTPFVLGFFRPKIYIPFGLDPRERAYILRHERYHLWRRDHLIKPFAFLTLTVHWFNPLVWLAFVLMSRDMEMSCDERVLSEYNGVAKEYGSSLLTCATNRRFPAASPLAFGETSIKKRVKNVLKFKKPRRLAAILASLLCITVVTACVANPSTDNTEPTAGQETVYTTHSA